jgi:ribosome-associated protein
VTDSADLEWVVAAARAADDKLANDTLVLAVGDLLGITDHFVITSASNARQVRAVAESIEEVLTVAGGPKPRRVEGLPELEWVLLDYGSFVVHVFHDETRRYFDLERLWADCERVTWQADGDGRPGESRQGESS